MSVNLKPLNDRIVALPVKPESKTVAGIYLPDSAQKRPVVSRVVAIGPNVKTVKVGDHILHSEYGGEGFDWDGEKYHIFKEEDILAIVENKKK